MGENMVVDFDVLQKDAQEFKLRGKKYTIPPPTYNLFLQLSMIDKQVQKAIKDNDTEAMTKLTIKGILLGVPEMPEEVIMNDVSIVEIRKIQELINETLQGEEEIIDPEIKFYREKYGDEFRKNSERIKEKKKISKK